MNRRSLSIPATALSAALLLAACGGSSATTAPTAGGVTPTSAAATTAALPTSATVPSAAPATVAAATVAPTDAQPTTPGATPGPVSVPSFASDNGLVAKFPTSVDGQPVTNVQTAIFADVLRQSGGTDTDVQKLTQTLSAIGIDFTTMSFGSAQATVDGEPVSITALRTPNTDANKIIQNYPIMVTAFGSPPEVMPTMSQSTISGKNVTLAVSSEGDTTVLYVSGDTLFILQSMTDSQTAKVIAALP